MSPTLKFSNFIFWQRWLFWSSVLFAAFGIFFAINGKFILFLPYDKMIASSLWHRSEFPEDAVIFRAFIYGPLGGTIACCYILLAFIAWYPFKEKQRWARNAILVAFGVWVLLDSSICLYYGAYPQIYIVNAFSILVKALPILFTWNDFNDNKINKQDELPVL